MACTLCGSIGPMLLIDTYRINRKLTKNSLDLTPKSLDFNFKIPGYSITIDYLGIKLFSYVLWISTILSVR